MTHTEKRIIAAARRWYIFNSGWLPDAKYDSEEKLSAACAADAAARKKARKRK